MKKIINVYNHLEEILLVVALIVMVTIVFIQVVMRFIFNNSLSWSEELARIIFIWMSWLGISYAEKKGEHIKITMVTDRLKGTAKKIVLVISDIFTLIILGVLCIEGIGVVDKLVQFGAGAASVPIPNWVIYSCVPFSCLMMGLRVIKSLVLTVRSKNVEEVV